MAVRHAAVLREHGGARHRVAGQTEDRRLPVFRLVSITTAQGDGAE
jgi:hypothetical protein